MRSFSFCTAAMTLRSSFTTMTMMSRTGVLSMVRLTGLIASVGSDCHLDWVCIGWSACALPDETAKLLLAWIRVKRLRSTRDRPRAPHERDAGAPVTERKCAVLQ